MPDRIFKVLQKDGHSDYIIRKEKRVRVHPNQAENILPVLEQLLMQDRSTEYAYLCHPSVRHVSKLHQEGMSRFPILPYCV